MMNTMNYYGYDGGWWMVDDECRLSGMLVDMIMGMPRNMLMDMPMADGYDGYGDGYYMYMMADVTVSGGYNGAWFMMYVCYDDGGDVCWMMDMMMDIMMNMMMDMTDDC